MGEVAYVFDDQAYSTARKNGIREVVDVLEARLCRVTYGDLARKEGYRDALGQVQRLLDDPSG